MKMKQIMPNSFLVIASHPDDEVLGCGGTMARLACEGCDVKILILGEGATSRFDQREEAGKEEVAQLQDDSKKAAEILGAQLMPGPGLPDNRFDSVALLDIVKIIERVIDEVQPVTVFTQHGGDLNIDHQVTFRAALTATRPVAGSPVRQVLAYEVASSTEWSYQQFSPVFQPQVFYDISDTLENKIQAMQAYEGESRTFPHPRSPEALRAQAAYRGAQAGMHAAEAFTVIRQQL